MGRKHSTQQAQGDDDDKEKAIEAPDNQIHEMSAPLPPAELDGDDCMSWNDDTELGTDNSHNLSAYEMARRKMDRQLQGPVPSYSPPADGADVPPEKAIYQPNPANGPPVALQLSPSASLKVSPEGGSNANSMALPSPLTPRFDPNSHAVNPSFHSLTAMPVSPTNDSFSSPNSPLSPHSDHQTIDSMTMGSDREPQSTNHCTSISQQRPVQRTPIDSSRIVLLGALPSNARDPVPQAASEEGYQATDDSSHDNDNDTVDSLGSNFTVDEEGGNANPQEPTRRLDLGTNGSAIGAAVANPQHNPSSGQPDTPRNPERINPGEDLVHVPQMAERRYSWE